MPRRHFTKKTKKTSDWRIRFLRSFFLLFIVVIIFRLYTLQVLNASFYSALASGQHSFYEELLAERGKVYLQDWKDDREYLMATNAPKAFVYADPRKIEDPKAVAEAIGQILGYENVDQVQEEDNVDEAVQATSILDGLEDIPEDQEIPLEEEIEEKEEENKEEVIDRFVILEERLSKKDDPYEPIEKGVSEVDLERILSLEFDGIYYILEDARMYPETELGGHVLGFVGQDSEGQMEGFYGIEGYFNDFLQGEDGYLDSETSISGYWTGVGQRHIEKAEDGGDVLLTLERNIQYQACKSLYEGVERYQADGGSVIIVEPATGRIMAMCNAPDFDPNDYANIEDIAVYNNSSIFEAYEPGSVFKPLVVAAALDQGVVNPSTIFNDTGEEEVDIYTIRNSDLESHGMVTLTEALELSLNTVMIQVMRKLTGPVMTRYIEDFGFSTITGISLDTESKGTIDSLYNDHEVYYATASYGQGLTVTPLQLVMSYAALANGGKLMKPYIVEELRYDNGFVEETKSQLLRQVITSSTATKIAAMMVSVIENGHATDAGVPGYYIAGKTGTAQVADQTSGGYIQGQTNATFVGFGPIENPAYAMIVTLNYPKTSPWAADTAAPIFGEISDFLVNYLEIIPSRSIEN